MQRQGVGVVLVVVEVAGSPVVVVLHGHGSAVVVVDGSPLVVDVVDVVLGASWWESNSCPAAPSDQALLAAFRPSGNPRALGGKSG